MRSMYSKDELFVAAARKKPRWQSYLDNLGNLSEADIDALNEPIWVRQSLTVLKKTKGQGQKQRIENVRQYAIEADKLQAERQNSERYEIRLWSGAHDFIKGQTMDGRRQWDVEIRTQEPFLIKDGSTVVISGEFYRLTPDEMLRVTDNSKSFKEDTMQGYFNYYKETYLNGRN